MDFIVKDILSGELVPVLLGISPEAMQTARRIFRQYGVVSHLFCDKIPLTMRLTYCVKFHVIRHGERERLMITALRDFAVQLGNADILLYLIPCTVDWANTVWQNRNDLEPYYVIASRPEMEKVWYGEPNTGEEAR